MGTREVGLPDPVALLEGQHHGAGVLRHQSHQQLQHVHEVVVLEQREDRGIVSFSEAMSSKTAVLYQSSERSLMVNTKHTQN